MGEDIADLAIGYYGASSALNRLLRLAETSPADHTLKSLARLVVAGYLEEAWRIWFRLRSVLFSEPHISENLDQLSQKLHLPFDPVAEVHALTDDLYHHGQYRFV